MNTIYLTGLTCTDHAIIFKAFSGQIVTATPVDQQSKGFGKPCIFWAFWKTGKKELFIPFLFDTESDSVFIRDLPRSSVSLARFFWAEISEVEAGLIPEFPVAGLDSS